LFDLFLVGNVLVPARAGIQRGGGTLVAIPGTDAFAAIGPAVGTSETVVAESAMARVAICRTVVAVGKCGREYEKACEDGADQQLTTEWLATRGSAHGRFLGNVKAFLAIGAVSIRLSDYKTDAPCPPQTQPNLNRK